MKTLLTERMIIMWCSVRVEVARQVDHLISLRGRGQLLHSRKGSKEAAAGWPKVHALHTLHHLASHHRVKVFHKLNGGIDFTDVLFK